MSAKAVQKIQFNQDLRLILKTLRDVMASSKSFQEKLEAIASLVAGGLGVDVCSLHIRKFGDVLELYAAHGLSADATPQKRLMLGENIVGRIALEGVSQTAYQNARSRRQDIEYTEEQGVYASFLGVPLLKEHKVVGVLSVQNKVLRQYAQEDMDTLETIAMVVAEILNQTDLVGSQDASNFGAGSSQRLEGTSLAPGIVIAKAFFHNPQIKVRKTVADDPVFEHKRFRDALNDVIYAIESLLNGQETPVAANDYELRNILEAYHLFSRDPVWVERAEKAIEAGLTADAAVLQMRRDIQKRLKRVKNEFFKERLREFEEIANRLLLHLSGVDGYQGVAEDEDFILFAKSLTPAEFLTYNRKNLKGIVLSDIAPTSHVTILAKTFDIPIVKLDASFFHGIDEEVAVVLDGNVGQLLVSPSDDVVLSFQNLILTQKRKKEILDRYRQKEAVTKDGKKINVMLNAALLADMVDFESSGASGIGLYRTEIPFIVHANFPTTQQQVQVYRKALDYVGDQPLYFRVLEIGGDKLLPYMRYYLSEQNPALGWRGMRILVDRPGLLRTQLRAIMEAGAGRHIHIMFPMVTTSEEFFMAKKLLDEAYKAMKKAKQPVPLSIKKGILLEIPSLYFELDYILPHIDFISFGTNDFFQFLHASDRGNSAMSTRYNFLSSGMLRICRDLVKKCEKHKVLLSTCGDKCGNPIEGLVLAGLGFRHLSMPSSQIGLMKAVFSKVDLAAFEHFLNHLLKSYASSYDEQIRHYMIDHGIPIDEMSLDER